jgi:hypothetical protein
MVEMKAEDSSETLVTIYQTTQCHTPKDSNFHSHWSEKLKFNYFILNICKVRWVLAIKVARKVSTIIYLLACYTFLNRICLSHSSHIPQPFQTSPFSIRYQM